MATEQLRFDRGIFEPVAAVRALRDARYRHPANAIAELIDNSVDANAPRVDVLIEERQERVKTRTRWRVHKLAVADNGHGMDADTLVQALRVGGRTASRRVRAIGKYGMGLPTASASQCRRVDVWTWRGSIDRSRHSWLDIGAIERGEMTEIPEADAEPVPAEWRQRIAPETLDPQQGTLVVWSEIDRITAQTDTIFRRIEQEIGRTYRHFINDGSLVIRMAMFREGRLRQGATVRPNDPLFLMPNSTTSAPWDREPMFEPYGQPWEYPVEINGREETVEVRYSIAKRAVIVNADDGAQFPGSLPHGQDARRNMGVSIVRADRELLLENAFVREGGGERIERWWGCEIRFGDGLDDLFGIDHNKQMATALSNAAREVFNTDEADKDALEDLLVSEDDPGYLVYKVVSDIRKTTRAMRRAIEELFNERRTLRKQARASGVGALTPEAEAEERATRAHERRLATGEPRTRTDRDHDELPEGDRQKGLTEFLSEEGAPDPEGTAITILRSDSRYKFLAKRLAGYQMFNVESVAGELIVSLNTDHPLHKFLTVVEERSEDLSDPLARESAVAIRTLLLAWAQMEDGIEVLERRQQMQDIALRWGQEARDVLAQLADELEAQQAS